MTPLKECISVFVARLEGKSYEAISYEKKLSYKTVYNILHGKSKNSAKALEILKMGVDDLWTL